MADLKETLQQLFSQASGGGTVIGLDIGSHSIKVCELSGSPGKYKLERFAAVALTEAAIIEDEVQKPEEFQEAVLSALTKAGIKSRTVCFGLFGQNTMVKRMSVPEGTDEETEDHITWESAQYIPFGADDSEIDYDTLSENEDGVKDTIVSAARTDIIEKYEQLLTEAKLTVKYVDLNVLALSNFIQNIVSPEMQDLEDGVILIDYGAQNIKLLVYRNGGPVFSKEIPLGGGLVTEEIQRQMALSYEEAEDLKITMDENGNIPDEVRAILEQQLESHVTEIKKSLNFYLAAGSDELVRYCFITGGCSRSPIVRQAISNVLGIEVNHLNPTEYGLKFDSRLDNIDMIMSIGVVAMGLGMRR